MKYKATISVEYNVEVEDIIGINQEDVEGYKNFIQSSYFEQSEEIEGVKGLILAELENAIHSNIPEYTPYTTKALKIKAKVDVNEMKIEEMK